MHYRPITKNNLSEINYPVFTVSGWKSLLGLLCVSIQVWSLSRLGLCLQIANQLDQNLSESSCLETRGIFWTEQLSEVSSSF